MTEEHYKLVEAPVPQPGEGEVLLKALYITVDPYMRIQQVCLFATDLPALPHHLFPHYCVVHRRRPTPGRRLTR